MNSEHKAMTPERAAFFLTRFKGDEKMLGPNEQAALDFAIQSLTNKPAGVDDQWVCQKCGCTAGVAGEPSWTHERTEHPVEAMWRCDRCDAEHFIKLWDRQIAAPTKPDSEAVHGFASASIDAATKAVFEPCDCGCGRSCCACCGTDLGFVQPSQPVSNAGDVADVLACRNAAEMLETLAPYDSATADAAAIRRLITRLPAPADEVGGEAVAHYIELVEAFHRKMRAVGPMTEPESIGILGLLACVRKLAAQPSQEDARDAALLDALAEHSWAIEPFDIPTGLGDADVGWQVVRFDMPNSHMIVAEVNKDDPRAAIRAAMAASGVKA